jgi:hypothetical protein
MVARSFSHDISVGRNRFAVYDSPNISLSNLELTGGEKRPVVLLCLSAAAQARECTWLTPLGGNSYVGS